MKASREVVALLLSCSKRTRLEMNAVTLAVNEDVGVDSPAP